MVMSAEDVGRKKRSRKRHHPQKRQIEMSDFPQLQQRSFNALFEYYEAHEAVCRLMKEENRQQADVDKAIERLQKSIEERSKCDHLVDQYLLDNHIDFPKTTYSSEIITHSSDVLARKRSKTNAPLEDMPCNSGCTPKSNEECIVENIRRWFVENKAVKDCEQRCMDIMEVVDAFLADTREKIRRTECAVSTQIVVEDDGVQQNVRNDDSMSCIIIDDDSGGEVLDKKQNIAIQADREHPSLAMIEEDIALAQKQMNTKPITDGNTLIKEAAVDRSETPVSILIIEDSPPGNAKNDEPTGCTTMDNNNGTDSSQNKPTLRRNIAHERIAESLMGCEDEWEQQCLATVPTHDAFLSDANKDIGRSDTPISVITLDNGDSSTHNTGNNEASRWGFISNESHEHDDNFGAFMNVESTAAAVTVSGDNNEWEPRYLDTAPNHEAFLNDANEKTSTSRGGTAIHLIGLNEYDDRPCHVNCDQRNESTFVSCENNTATGIVKKKHGIEKYIDQHSMAKGMFENIAECDGCVTIEDLTPSLQSQAEFARDIEMEVFDEWFMEIRKEREFHKRVMGGCEASENLAAEANMAEFAFINSKYKSMRRKLSRSHVLCYKTMEKLQRMEENNAKLNKRIHELTEKLNRRDIEAMKQVVEYDQVKVSLNEANEMLERQRKQSAELFEKLRISEAQLLILQDALNTMSSCNVELSTKLQQTCTEITAAKAQCELLKEEKKALEKQADALKATALSARHAYMESASKLDEVMGANKQIAEERDALRKQHSTIYWNPYGEMIRSLQSNIATIQSPITTNPGNNAFNCVILPAPADPSVIAGTSGLMAIRHSLPQCVTPFGQYPQMHAVPTPSDGIQNSSTRDSLATAKSNTRRRRPRNGNAADQAHQIAMPHEETTSSEENVDQRGESPINVVDMP